MVRFQFWWALALAALAAIMCTPNGDDSLALWGAILVGAQLKGMYARDEQLDAQA